MGEATTDFVIATLATLGLIATLSFVFEGCGSCSKFTNNTLNRQEMGGS